MCIFKCHAAACEQARLQRGVLPAALVISLLAPALVNAQEGGNVSQLDSISVTGSRIKRAEMEGPAPVTVISSDQIRAEGFVTVYDALQSMTEVTGTVLAQANVGSAPNASPLNMRNLGPGRTLMLIDGRRVADYPLPYQGQSNFANFNNIPMALVERIEVLSSGGSAIYGSDAMAGVINIIMKKDYQGDEARIKAGTAVHGGSNTFDISWVGGRSGSRWNATYGLQWHRRQTLFAGSRSLVDSDFRQAETVKPLVKDPWPWVWGAEMIGADTGQRITPPQGACTRFEDFELHEYQGNFGESPEYPGFSCAPMRATALWSLRNGSNNLSGFGNFSYEFEDGMQAWVNAQVWEGEGESRQGWPLSFSLNTDRPFFDQNSGQSLIARRSFTVPEAGGRTPLLFYTNERSWDLAAGLRGTLAGRFDWDVMLGRTEYQVDFSFPAILQNTIDQHYLGSRLGVTPDGLPIYRLDQDRFWNPVGSDTFRQLTTHGHSSAYSWMNQAQFVLTGNLFDLPAGPVGFATVLEAGSQGYQLTPDPLTLPGRWEYDQPGGTSQGGGSRKRYALGAEFKLPLFSTLEMTAAARFDRYDDESRKENNTTWNLGLEWRPIQSLLLRTAYNTTFRAPDMHYLFASGGFGNEFNRDYATCVIYNQHPACASQGAYYYRHDFTRTGNLDLESETGKSWSAGIVWDVTDSLSFSADYWQMSIDNQVREFSNMEILELENQCRHGFASDPSSIAMQVTPGSATCADIIARVTRSRPGTNALGLNDPYYQLGQVVSVHSAPINVALQEVAGVDASARYRFPATAWGNFSAQLSYTNQIKNDMQRTADAPVEQRRDGEGEFRTQTRASITWVNGDWNATMLARRIGHVPGDNYNRCAPLPTDECHMVGRLKAPIYVNLNVGWQMTPQAQVNVYIENLFDEYKYKDPWKAYFLYANERIFSRVGREVSAEFVYRF